MRVETEHYFTEKDEESATHFRKLGVRKNVAMVLVFLSKTPEASSREIEHGTGLRQPEISTATTYLIDQGWVRHRDISPEGKGRPTKIYELVKSLPEIRDCIAKVKFPEPGNNLAFIRKLRNYHDRTLQVLTMIAIIYAITALIWGFGISVPVSHAPALLGPFDTAAPLAPPLLISPGSGQPPGPQVPVLTPQLQWSEVPGADCYTVHIFRSPFGPDDSMYASQPVYATSIVVPDGVLAPGEVYRWTVEAHSGAGVISISFPLYFTVETPVTENLPSV
jgi:predicted transcriptional regulator